MEVRLRSSIKKARNRSTKSTHEKAINLSKVARVTEQARDSKISIRRHFTNEPQPASLASIHARGARHSADPYHKSPTRLPVPRKRPPPDRRHPLLGRH